jgi:hypothetical protein
MIESMPKNRPDQAGRVGLRPKPQHMARHSSRQRADVSNDRRCGDGDARRDRIAIGRRRRRAVWAALQHTSRQPPPVPARTDGGGRRGAWHQLGLLMGSCSWVASPQICVTGEEMLLAGTTTTTTAQRQTYGAEMNRAARAGKLRLDSCGRAARRAIQARRWDAMQGIWYARVLERCHMPSRAHLLNEARR